MERSILVLNAGSSSLKFAVYQGSAVSPLRTRIRGQIADLHGQPAYMARDGSGARLPAPTSAPTAGNALEWLIDAVHTQGLDFDAVGHRVVHGGMHFAHPLIVDPVAFADLEALVPLAPLHQPHNLAAIQRLADSRPGMPQVACFDTAFHRSNADLVQRYAIPDALHQAGIRRYGFHGLSYAYIAAVLGEHDACAASGKTIVLHLGNGASLCALDAGVSIASSMGFSALDGVPMATRSGSIDPGVILHLLAQRGMDAAAVESLLYRGSGLLGVSGVSGDMRTLGASSEPLARTAIDLFVYRIVREIGSLVAALGGLDALVFTAGIGENDAAVRAQILDALGWLGVRIDASANTAHGPRISTPDSRVAALVIPTDEEAVIARQTQAALDGRVHST